MIKTLTAEATVGGRKIAVSTSVSDDVWNDLGPGFHEYCKAQVRRKLIEEIFKVWTPVVKVH
jgi:hypothetical protein